METNAPPSPWITIHDAKLTSDALARSLKNTDIPLSIFPEFDPKFPLDLIAQTNSPRLYQHLKALNDYKLPNTEMVTLLPSKLESLPFLGKFLTFIRNALHQLTLYYINRHIRYLTQRRLHLLHVLNELARLHTSQTIQLKQLRKHLDGQT